MFGLGKKTSKERPEDKTEAKSAAADDKRPEQRGEAMFETKLLIGGQMVDAEGGATFERKDPVTGEVASRAAAATPKDAVKAVENAYAAFGEWSAMGPNARRAALLKAADIMKTKGPDWAERCRAETGSTAGWGHFNTAFAAALLTEAAAITSQVNGEVIPSDYAGTFSMAVRQPCGVVLGIAPWNAPVILGVRSIAVPIAVGNTAILKASEICPATHMLIGEVFKEAGIPDGVLNVVTHKAEDAGEVVEAMIAHKAVRRVNFTGSTRVGKLIAQTSAKYLKPVVLELGGKAPLVVLDDADLDEAVNAAVFGAFMHQGQICMSTERIVAHKGIADTFLEKFKARTEGLGAGNPHTSDAPLGAVVDLETAGRVNELIEDAVAKGASTPVRGAADGTVVSPSIVDNVTQDMRIWREESFGPVVSMIRANDDDHAVELANDTDYGLSAAVFSQDVSRALAVARRIDSGICHINSPTVQDEAQMPFGGVKDSGYGRFGGRYGIEAFTETRWISIATKPRHYPI